MSEKNNGGPAFPLIRRDIGYHADIRQEAVGLSLRDYFAAKFMQGWMASWNGPNPNQDGLKLTAETAYEMADAMIRARDCE